MSLLAHISIHNFEKSLGAIGILLITIYLFTLLTFMYYILLTISNLGRDCYSSYKVSLLDCLHLRENYCCSKSRRKSDIFKCGWKNICTN